MFYISKKDKVYVFIDKTMLEQDRYMTSLYLDNFNCITGYDFVTSLFYRCIRTYRIENYMLKIILLKDIGLYK